MRDIGGTSQLFSGDQSSLKASTALTGLDESGIKPRQFCIITASKSVNGMWTADVFKMEEHFVMDRIIVEINNLTEKIDL